MMKNQMGMDPTQCDPVTISLIRDKFFGGGEADVKKQKEKKRKASKKNNVVDMFDEDEGAAVVNHKEADIHIPKNTKKKVRVVKGDPNLI
jgi:hypothetical protein